VLAACIVGVVLEACREAKRREFAAAGRPAPPGLHMPVLVLILPKGWATTQARVAVVAQPRARAYEFRWAAGRGVAFKRSPTLTITQALDHAYSRFA